MGSLVIRAARWYQRNAARAVLLQGGKTVDSSGAEIFVPGFRASEHAPVVLAFNTIRQNPYDRTLWVSHPIAVISNPGQNGHCTLERSAIESPIS